MEPSQAFCRKGEAWGLRAPLTEAQVTERVEGPILGHPLWALAQHQPLWISISIFKVRIAWNQHWMFTDAEAPIFWPPDVKSQLIRKDPYAGKDWRQEEKGATKDETVGWQHWLNGCEFEQPLGDNEGQRSLACCSPWGGKELNMTEWVNNNNSNTLCLINILNILHWMGFRGGIALKNYCCCYC